jgi:hypothetical protein
MLLVTDGDDLDVCVVLKLVEYPVISQSHLPGSERIPDQPLAPLVLFIRGHGDVDPDSINDHPLLEDPIAIEVDLGAR